MDQLQTKDLIKAIKRKGKSLEAEMSFFDHIDALRMHLVRASIAIILFTCLAFIFYDFIFNNIILGPKKADFFTYRALCFLGENLHLGPNFCIKNIPFNIINTEMGGQFTLQMNSLFLIGIITGFPYLLFELWRSVKPALHQEERQSTSGFIFYATLLFILGVFFGYFIITPLSINFLANFQVSEMIQNQITISSYLSTIATLSIGTGLVFELPIIVLVLSKLGLITPKLMRVSRRYAIVIMLIIAAVITPSPDLLTMLTVSFPMFFLYEISILVSNKIEKKKLHAEKIFYNHP